MDSAPGAMPPSTMRVFLGIELPEARRQAVRRLQEQLKRERAHVGWVPPANFHVSIAFLGDITPSQLEGLTRDAAGVSAIGPFTLRLRGLGTFGSPRSPAVIWAGIDPNESLAGVHRAVTTAAARNGISVELRPFRAHVTLGRVRGARGRAALLGALAAKADCDLGEWAAREIAVIRSVLTAAGAVYSVLHRLPLAGAQPP